MKSKKKIRLRSPFPTVDIIIEYQGGIVLIKRKNPPPGWAIPGGFVDYNESLERAARRETNEETGLKVVNLRQFHTYSEPGRDPRFHTISTVYIAKGKGTLRAGDDAGEARVFKPDKLPAEMAFDHHRVIKDYLDFKRDERQRTRLRHRASVSGE